MEKQVLSIGGVPAILWGTASKRLFLAVHGDQSHKADDVIGILAEEATAKGYRVLSFDLPEHGGRTDDSRLCNAQNCVEDLEAVMQYARSLSEQISLFGCSIGAYFSMLAYRDEPLGQTLFLSPVVDMKRIIENMMTWFDVSKQRLEQEREIPTPVKTLHWDYYQYVLSHPVAWDKPTALLYGANDSLCAFDSVQAFAERLHADLTILTEGEHFFHTGEQLGFLRRWLKRSIKGSEQHV